VNSQTSSLTAILKRRFASTPRGAHLARREAQRSLAAHGLDDRGAPVHVVAEFVANAVTHGNVPGREFELRLGFVADEQGKRLRIEVSDARGECAPTVPAEAPDADAESGRGLWIAAAFAQSWGVDRRSVGKTVWAELPVP
jgi:anti-sigma regulatory factor (Ser/Thr protein kinase)